MLEPWVVANANPILNLLIVQQRRNFSKNNAQMFFTSLPGYNNTQIKYSHILKKNMEIFPSERFITCFSQFHFAFQINRISFLG